MGQTYTDNMKEWATALNKRIHEIADRKGIVLSKEKVVPEQKLQGLHAKLREILAMGYDLDEFLEMHYDLDYNPMRDEWMRDLIK